MGWAVLYLKQTIAGRNYTTSWGLINPGATDPTAPFDAADWDEWTGGNPSLENINVATTVTTAAPYNINALGVIGAILAFHRYLQSDLVTYTGVYVTDGRRNNSEDSSYVSVPFSARGLGTIQSTGPDEPENMAPANIPLMLSRSTAPFQGRPGRCYIRACLRESDIRLGGNRGVDWQGGQMDFWGLRLDDAFTASNLNQWLPGGMQPVQLGVPHYYTKDEVSADPSKEGQVKYVNTMAQIAVQAPTPRQVGRGRRR